LKANGNRRIATNFKTASRQNQHWYLAGIDGINQQIVQTAITTKLPCQQAAHINVAQLSSETASSIISDFPFAGFPSHGPNVSAC
jgi:hypothetical protein